MYVATIMKGITTDGWTSLANLGYVTCAAHFIDKTIWKLHSMLLGLFEKHTLDHSVKSIFM
jgi:hypothetical protein